MSKHLPLMNAATLLLALGSTAQAVVIDNFGSAYQGQTSCIGTATFNLLSSGAIGGDRDVTCSRVAGDQPTDTSSVETANLDTDFNILAVNNEGVGTKTNVTVLWDGLSAAGLNANLIPNGEDTFSMIVASLDLTDGFRFIVTIVGDNASSMSYEGLGGAGLTSYPDFRRIKVSLSDFTGYDTAILMDVKSITLELKTEVALADFSIGTLETTPEPGTLALLGLGAGALGGFMRRRRQAT